jgi:site-specific recombinase XerC
MTAEKKAEVKAEEKKAEEQAAPETLPPEMTAALAAFERHLRAERSLSPHTVRAYLGDVSSLLEYAHRVGAQAPADLAATHLRGWLASQHASGAARTTLARRGSAARTFTAFGHRCGWLAVDPGPRLGTLKTRRTLPHVLRQDEMRTVLDTANRAAQAGAPAAAAQAPESPAPAPPAPAPIAATAAEAAVALRDAAVLELLYATGIRVSELCALTADSFDYARRTVRVRGKGDKERTVPVGVPGHREQRTGPVPRRTRRPPGPAYRPPDRPPAPARRRRDPRHGPARPAPHRGHPPARRRRRPAQRPGDPGPLLARDHPDIHACLDRAPQVQLPPGPSPSVRNRSRPEIPPPSNRPNHPAVPHASSGQACLLPAASPVPCAHV